MAERNATAGGFGGGGAGTGLVGLAEAVGVNTTLGKVLVFVAPAASVIGGAVVYFVLAKLDARAEERVIANARKTLQDQLELQNLAADKKREIKKLLGDLEVRIAMREVARATQSVRIVGASNANSQ